MNRWTDGQTDESDFIGRCPTNVEHPKRITGDKFDMSMKKKI